MRYSRQEILPEIGHDGQARLKQARVLMVGAGGLGCPALLYLAGAGVGTLGIIDPDTIDISNLHRQVLYSTRDQGRPKAECAKARILDLNPEIRAHTYAAELDADNAERLFQDYDLIIDGTDRFAAKFLISDAAVKTGKPLVYGAIQGFEGQVGIFDSNGGSCYRCLYPQPPLARVMNCAEAGVIGAVAGTIGTLQAMEAIKVIVDNPALPPRPGRVSLIDLRTLEMRAVNVPKRPDCPACAKERDSIQLSYQSPACSAAPSSHIAEMSVDEAAALEGAVFVDVRERGEWEAGHIDGAHHLPLSALVRDPGLFTPMAREAGPYVLYCQKGIRSMQAAEILAAEGFTDLINMAGGYAAWINRR